MTIPERDNTSITSNKFSVGSNAYFSEATKESVEEHVKVGDVFVQFREIEPKGENLFINISGERANAAEAKSINISKLKRDRKVDEISDLSKEILYSRGIAGNSKVLKQTKDLLSESITAAGVAKKLEEKEWKDYGTLSLKPKEANEKINEAVDSSRENGLALIHLQEDGKGFQVSWREFSSKEVNHLDIDYSTDNGTYSVKDIAENVTFGEAVGCINRQYIRSKVDMKHKTNFPDFPLNYGDLYEGPELEAAKEAAIAILEEAEGAGSFEKLSYYFSNSSRPDVDKYAKSNNGEPFAIIRNSSQKRATAISFRRPKEKKVKHVLITKTPEEKFIYVGGKGEFIECKNVKECIKSLQEGFGLKFVSSDKTRLSDIPIPKPKT